MQRTSGAHPQLSGLFLVEDVFGVGVEEVLHRGPDGLVVEALDVSLAFHIACALSRNFMVGHGLLKAN